MVVMIKVILVTQSTMYGMGGSESILIAINHSEKFEDEKGKYGRWGSIEKLLY